MKWVYHKEAEWAYRKIFGQYPEEKKEKQLAGCVV
jgi:hypothetical protein